jgi:hypothetical protein
MDDRLRALTEQRAEHERRIGALAREMAREREALTECSTVLRALCPHAWHRDKEAGGPHSQYICTWCRLVR